MVKRASSGKKKIGKTRSNEAVYPSSKEVKVERALIENFIGLQRVMVNLSSKFEALSSQISRLLDLFEISAKTLAKKEISSGDSEAKRIMEKLENLSQQAGLIGKGLALIHEVRTENEPIRVSQPLNQKMNKVQFSSSATSPPSASVHPSVSGMPPSQKKMTKELGEFEKSPFTKQKRLGEDANVGTNI